MLLSSTNRCVVSTRRLFAFSTRISVPLGDDGEGELIVGGPLLACRYWEDKERTDEEFFTHGDGERFFRTRDRVCHVIRCCYCGSGGDDLCWRRLNRGRVVYYKLLQLTIEL